MANEQTPTLVKKDGERVTPAQAAVTREDMLEIVKAIVGGQQAASEAANAKTDAVVDALQHIRADINKGEYNIANFPNVSAFNPLGENATVGGTPRPALIGEVAWVGTPCVAHEMTAQEIALMNRLQPGEYHNAQWVVTDQQPGVRGTRKLRVDFPNKEQDQRADLPNGYFHPTEKVPMRDDLTGEVKMTRRWVTGMEQMLQEMVDEAESRNAVLA